MCESRSAAALAEQGLFHRKMPDFVPRAAQQEMARCVEETIAHQGSLVAESGTGTGKTFAYLVPLLLSGKKAIVSTATKHLQEQIFSKDLPLVARLLGQDVKARLLKGRANYLCRYRLGQYVQQTDLIAKETRHSSAVIENWAVRTTTGDISEVTGVNEDSPIWKQVTSTAENCLGGQCPDYDRCFVKKARHKAMESTVVVVNHHLYFSDRTLKTDGFGELLPNHEVVVFDEAHHIAKTASQFFGFSISNYQMLDLMKDIVTTGENEGSGVNFSATTSSVEQLITRLHHHLTHLKSPAIEFSAIQTEQSEAILDAIQRGLDKLEQALDQAKGVGEGVNRCHDRCLELQNKLDQWWRGAGRQTIRWASVSGRRFSLVATPLSVRDPFRELIAVPKISWIFTSATLAVGEDFSAFCAPLGLDEAELKQWPSPYCFESHSLLYLPPSMPDPRTAEFADALTEQIHLLTEASRGRAFCLFTSYAMMEGVCRRLRPLTRFPVLVQGEAAKQRLLNQFVRSPDSILLGTTSFWEGVDVKGPSLSCVIIDKLPFASPSDPVLKSKLRDCEERGKNPFMDIQVPDAVIMFKQGAGRLIRSEQDQGVLVVCDSRIKTKPYGRLFLQSLPPMPRTDSIEAVRGFLSDL